MSVTSSEEGLRVNADLGHRDRKFNSAPQKRRRSAFRCLLSRLALITLPIIAVLVVAIATPALANDSAGFNYGTDNSGPPPKAGGPPWQEPTCGGYYGFYDGRVDTVPDGYMILSDANDANNSWYGYSEGVGALTDWDLTGPEDDPNFASAVANGTEDSEAVSYGEKQGQVAATNWNDWAYHELSQFPPNPVIFMDIEGGNPGWSDLGYGSEAYTWNRDVFNGFWDDVTASDIEGGDYTDGSFWNQEFGSSSTTPHTWEWTSDQSWSGVSSAKCPQNWSSTSDGTTFTAMFYAGQSTSSNCAACWQWVSSGAGDYDQVDTSRVDTYTGTTTCGL